MNKMASPPPSSKPVLPKNRSEVPANDSMNKKASPKEVYKPDQYGNPVKETDSAGRDVGTSTSGRTDTGGTKIIVGNKSGNSAIVPDTLDTSGARKQVLLEREKEAQSKRILEGKERPAEQAARIATLQNTTEQSKLFQQLAEQRRQELLSKAGKEAEMAHVPQYFFEDENGLAKSQVQVQGEAKGFYKQKGLNNSKELGGNNDNRPNIRDIGSSIFNPDTNKNISGNQEKKGNAIQSFLDTRLQEREENLYQTADILAKDRLTGKKNFPAEYALALSYAGLKTAKPLIYTISHPVKAGVSFLTFPIDIAKSLFAFKPKGQIEGVIQSFKEEPIGATFETAGSLVFAKAGAKLIEYPITKLSKQTPSLINKAENIVTYPVEVSGKQGSVTLMQGVNEVKVGSKTYNVNVAGKEVALETQNPNLQSTYASVKFDIESVNAKKQSLIQGAEKLSQDLKINNNPISNNVQEAITIKAKGLQESKGVILSSDSGSQSITKFLTGIKQGKKNLLELGTTKSGSAVLIQEEGLSTSASISVTKSTGLKNINVVKEEVVSGYDNLVGKKSTNPSYINKLLKVEQKPSSIEGGLIKDTAKMPSELGDITYSKAKFQEIQNREVAESLVKEINKRNKPTVEKGQSTKESIIEDTNRVFNELKTKPKVNPSLISQTREASKSVAKAVYMQEVVKPIAAVGNVAKALAVANAVTKNEAKTKTLTIQNQKQQQVPESREVQKAISLPQQRQISIESIGSRDILKPISDVTPNQDVTSKADVFQIQQPIQQTKQDVIQEQQVIQIQQPITKTRTSTNTKKLTITPRIEIPLPVGKTSTKKKKKSIVKLAIRRRGKFQKIAQMFETPEQAFDVGKRGTEKTLAASFRVEDEGGNVIDNIKRFVPSNFYKSRKERGVFIQKAFNRLSQRTEVAEIQQSKRIKNIFSRPLMRKRR